MMSDLDPATLAKFQKFQAMLAESPEIVAALNSPEILALAARQAEKNQIHSNSNNSNSHSNSNNSNSNNINTNTNATAHHQQNAAEHYQHQHQPMSEQQQQQPQQPAPEAEPEYPMVGYGVSDDVSIMSEMTTPTVMTRQSVEEDEFYPEVDGKGSSSSGLGGNLRRIGGMNTNSIGIGVSAHEDGSLPPPPPRSSASNGLKMKSGHKLRRSTIRTKKMAMMAPLSKIAEIDGASVVSHDTGATEPSATSNHKTLPKGSHATNSNNNSNWRPKPASLSSSNASPLGSEKKLEPHPFFGTSGAGTVRGTARHGSFNARTRRTTKGQRGIHRNRSMPTAIKQPTRTNSAGESVGSVSLSASSDSLSNVENEDHHTTTNTNTTATTNTKTSSGDFNFSTTTRNSLGSVNSGTRNSLGSVNSGTKSSVGSHSTPPITKNNTRRSRPKTSLSPHRTSFRNSLGTSGTSSTTTPNGRGINRNRSMPVKLNSNGSTGASSKSECLFFDDDDTNTKTSSTAGNSVSPSTSTNTSTNEEKSTTPKEARSQSSKSQKSLTPPRTRTGRGLFRNTGSSTKKPRGKSVPRMRLVPVASKSICSAESSPAKITTREDQTPPSRTRSRSLSKYTAAAAAKAANDDKNINSTTDETETENDDDTSRPSEAESVPRMRMIPVPSKSICSAESRPGKMTTRSDQSKQTRPRSRSLSKFTAAATAKVVDDDKNSNSTSDETESDDDTGRPSKAESVPRMRMIPVPSKSICSAESSPGKMTARSGQSKQTRPRSRSLSKFTAAFAIAAKVVDGKDKNKDDDTSRPSGAIKTSTEDAKYSESKTPFTVVKSFHQTDDDSDEINSTELSVSTRSSGSEDSKMVRSEEFLKGSSDHSSKNRPEDLPAKSNRSSVTRRWKPPVVDNSALPPAFRLSSSNHAQKSRGRFGARVSSSSNSSSIKSEQQQENRSEEQKETTSDDDEKDPVQPTVRKSVKERSSDVDKNSTASRPNPEQFKQYLSELTHVIQTTGNDNTDRPSDYIGSPFAATRKKRQSKKKNLGNASETSAPRATDWLGSGKTQKRTWRVKGA